MTSLGHFLCSAVVNFAAGMRVSSDLVGAVNDSNFVGEYLSTLEMQILSISRTPMRTSIAHKRGDPTPANR